MDVDARINEMKRITVTADTKKAKAAVKDAVDTIEGDGGDATAPDPEVDTIQAVNDKSTRDAIRRGISYGGLS